MQKLLQNCRPGLFQMPEDAVFGFLDVFGQGVAPGGSKDKPKHEKSVVVSGHGDAGKRVLEHRDCGVLAGCHRYLHGSARPAHCVVDFLACDRHGVLEGVGQDGAHSLGIRLES